MTEDIETHCPADAGEIAKGDVDARFVDKWARYYIHVYRTKGAMYAKKWALEFLPVEPRNKMIERVNELLGK
jgi:hypothetical protein